jgi:O-antigen ligase
MKSMSNAINIFIFLSALSALVFPPGYTLFPLILACFGWYFLFLKGLGSLMAINVKTALFFIIACWLFAITGILIDVSHEVTLGALEIYLPFLIYPVLITLYVQFTPRFEFFYVGAATSSILALIWTLYMILIEGASRPSLHGTAISFGNTGALIAVTCSVAYAVNKSINPAKKVTSYVLICGVLSGIGVSLLSGSKGGWISLLTFFILFYWRNFIQLSRVRKIAILVSISMLSLLLLLHPSSILNQRLTEAKIGFEYWVETGLDRDGSVGARLNMYSFGIGIADDVPLFGLGPRGVDELWIEQAALGKTDPNWAPNGRHSHAGNHLHSEFLTVYLWKGPFGLFAHLLIYLSAAIHFYRLRKSKDLIASTAATLGLFTLICYVEFALTDAGWYVNANRQIFLFWILTLFGVTLSSAKGSALPNLSTKVKRQ